MPMERQVFDLCCTESIYGVDENKEMKKET